MTKHTPAQKAKRIGVLVILVVGVAVVLRGTVTMGLKYVQARKVQAVYANELGELEEQKNYLNDQLDALVSEDGIEYFVREHYRKVKPDERLIILVDDEAGTDSGVGEGQ